MIDDRTERVRAGERTSDSQIILLLVRGLRLDLKICWCDNVSRFGTADDTDLNILNNELLVLNAASRVNNNIDLIDALAFIVGNQREYTTFSINGKLIGQATVVTQFV